MYTYRVFCRVDGKGATIIYTTNADSSHDAMATIMHHNVHHVPYHVEVVAKIPQAVATPNNVIYVDFKAKRRIA